MEQPNYFIKPGIYYDFVFPGVEAVAIHGGKDQEERSRAVEAFRKGEKDVLVATDVASKGTNNRKYRALKRDVLN